MSVTSVGQKVATNGTDDDGERSNGGRIWILGAIVAIAAVVAGFYGIDA
jgi:hypothetical protein